MTRRRLTLALLSGLMLLWGCATMTQLTPTIPPAGRPADFQITYDWNNGSLPPPYHYSYTLTLGPGAQGKLEYVPGYGSQNPPVWTETFPVTAADLDRLYALAVKNNLLRAAWPTVENPIVGGAYGSADLTAAGQTFSIPGQLNEADQAPVAEFYAALTAVPPQALWDKFDARREAFTTPQP